MAKKKKAQYTDSMVAFGRLLKVLRCPDIYKYKLKAAVNTGLVSTSVDVAKLFYSNRIVFEDLFPDEEILNDFRAIQAAARRFKLKMFSLREVAELTGINKNTLHDYEQGKRYPPVEFIYDLCDALEINVDEILNAWLKYHPQKNIRQHSQLTLDKYFFHHLSVSHEDKERVNLVQFFQKALLGAFYRNKILFPYFDKLKGITLSLVDIIDESIEEKSSLDGSSLRMGDESSLEQNAEKLKF